MTQTESATFVTSLASRSVLQFPPEQWTNICRDIDQAENLKSKLEPDLFQTLLDTLVLVSDEKDELEGIEEKSLLARSVSDTFGLVIVPSMACNMNCHYCFENKSNQQTLSTESSQALTNFVREKLSDRRLKSLHVRWFGGEPLNNPDLIESTMTSLRCVGQDLQKHVFGDIVTNGYALTGDMAARLSNQGLSSAQITFDGEKKQHDKIRRVARAGSYERLVTNILDAAEHMDVRIRVHVAPYNLDGIPRLLEDFANRGLQRAIDYLYFAPLFNYDQDSKEHAFAGDDRLFLTSYDFSVAVIPLLRVAKSLGLRLADPLDTDYSVCTALREYTAVVNPDGTLSKCYMDAGDYKESYGGLANGVERPENLVKWRQMHFANDPECRACNFAPICLGGCSKEVMLGASKEAICTPLKYNLDRVIPLHYCD